MKTETTAPLFDMSVATYAASDEDLSAKREFGQAVAKTFRAVGGIAVKGAQAGEMAFEYINNEGREAIAIQVEDIAESSLNRGLKRIDRMVTRGLNVDEAGRRKSALMAKYLQ